MNIFIMILAFILMAGYFLIDAPSQRMRDTGIESAINMAEIKSILSCMSRQHSKAIDIDTENRVSANEIFNTDIQPCTEKYNVQTIKMCADNNRLVSNCTPERDGRVTENYIITTADLNDNTNTNLVLKSLSKDFNSIGNFGIITNEQAKTFSILSGNGYKRSIPKSLSFMKEIADGRLIYITRYSVPFNQNTIVQTASDIEDITCMNNEQKVFRFGKWECQTETPPVLCTGNTIWDSDSESCEIDPSLRPLCATGQTAVDIDDVWQCIDPTPIAQCPDNTIAQFDYTNMEWVCTAALTENTSKCQTVTIAKGTILGGTLLKPANVCNSCEKMIVDEETCNVACIPDETKVTNSDCYPNYSECSGSSRAFYFGFPDDAEYEANAREYLSKLSGITIPTDVIYSQNRKFNCLDCGIGGTINEELSVLPFIAICE
ncbi:MAG: hypothetical protein WC137_02780 [Alphaproteobacteria bacterium]